MPLLDLASKNVTITMLKTLITFIFFPNASNLGNVGLVPFPFTCPYHDAITYIQLLQGNIGGKKVNCHYLISTTVYYYS